MRLVIGCGMIRALTLSLTIGLLAASPLYAETSWRVDPDFGKKSRKDMSGAACTAERCIAVNDETHYAQEFDLKKRRIKPGERIRLLDKGDEIDAEAITATGNTFYISGSHGLSRKKSKLKLSSFKVFRIDGEEIEATDRLRAAIRGTPALSDYAEESLTRNGVNIEGLAAQGDRLFFGFRGPSVKGTAFILEASAKALFSSAPLNTTLHAVDLGERIGIRDLAAVEDGILILSGPVNTLPRRYTLALWRPDSGTLIPLTQVPLPGKGKPEGILVLDDGSKSYDVLVFYDGPRNGAPRQLSANKP